jgi:long-chain acyl-CoA synthetase
MTHDTIFAAFRETAARHPKKPALRHKGADGAYRSISYETLGDSVDRLAASLERLGVARGDRVAILAYHGPEWITADLAALKLGAVIVPLYHTLSPAAAKYILNDSGCRVVFVEGRELFAVIDAVRAEVPSLEHVVVFDDEGIEGSRAFLRFGDLTARDVRHERDAGGSSGAVSPADPATIVYTSGTTGSPKGVVLSHGNILFDAFSTMRRFRVDADDVFLSFLPLCHMFERTCGHYTMLFAGATIAYAGGVSTIVNDVQEIRPTIIIVVPRIVEKIYEAVERKVLEDEPALSRRAGAAFASSEMRDLRSSRRGQVSEDRGREAPSARFGRGTARPKARQDPPRLRLQHPRRLRSHRDGAGRVHPHARG